MSERDPLAAAAASGFGSPPVARVARLPQVNTCMNQRPSAGSRPTEIVAPPALVTE